MKQANQQRFIRDAGRAPTESEISVIEAGEQLLDAKLTRHVDYIFNLWIFLGFALFFYFLFNQNYVIAMIFGGFDLVGLAYGKQIIQWALSHSSAYDFL